MPDPIIYDDQYLAEEGLIGLLQQVLPDASYVRGSDRETIVQPSRISVTAEVMEIPGGDMFEIAYSILCLFPADADVTDATRRTTVRTITNYLRTVQGKSIHFPAIRFAMHGPTVGKADESSCKDSSEADHIGDEIVLTAGGQRNIDTAQFDTESGS